MRRDYQKNNSTGMAACLRPNSQEGGGAGDKQKSIVEIYTDWANHYLEKTKGKHKIKSL